MADIEDGGQAFPHGDPTHGGDIGMSLRDWFAGQALTGELAAENLGEGFVTRLRSEENASMMADRAYQLADAMLAARLTQQEPSK